MILFNFLARLISVLQAAATPPQIGAGFVVGMAMGFTPSAVMTALLGLVLIIFNVNITAALAAAALCRFVAYALDPVFHSLGYIVLVEAGFLRPLFTAIYNTPFIPFTGFNNTVVMGGMVVSLALAAPVYFGVKRGIILYRGRWEKRIRNWKAVRVITTSSSFQSAYQGYRFLHRLGEKLW
jgi:uncharacterized protein (TIGR03546 family)